MSRIYLTSQRPPVPGSIPRSGLLEIHGFDERRPVTYLIDERTHTRKAWGYVIYDHDLTYAEQYRYELLEVDEVLEGGNVA